MYGLLSIKKAGQPNWTAPAFVSLGILATAYWHEKVEQQPQKQKFVLVALLLGFAMSLAALSTDMLRCAGIPIPYRKVDPSARLRGWKTMAIAVEDYRKEFEKETGKPAFMIGNNYQTAALLSFYLPDPRVEGPDHPAVYLPESQDIESEFSFWPKYDDFVDAPPGTKPGDQYFSGEEGVNVFVGRNALYVTDAIDDTPPSSLERGFESVKMVKMVNISRHGLPLRQIRIFACYNYQTLPL